MNWLWLSIAIISETIATSALKASVGFTRFLPSILVIIGYVSSFFFLSMSLKTIPIGVVYAIWSGVGIVLITFVGLFLYHEKLDLPAVIGIVFIGFGVIIMNVFSKTAGH
jgi:small multidrug resistance pump